MMRNTYDTSIAEATRRADIHEAQRRDIEKFYEGNKGQDMNTLIAHVSGAVKNARRDVATLVRTPDTPLYKISDIIDNSRVVKLNGVPDELNKIKDSNIAPELALDPLPEIVKRLSMDQLLTDEERVLLGDARFSLMAAKEVLEHAKTKANATGSKFSHDTAVQAGVALEIIDKQLMPALNLQRGGEMFLEKMTEFASREQYHERGSNEVYKRTLSELSDPPAYKAPKKHTSRIASKLMGPAAFITAGVVAGAAGTRIAEQEGIIDPPASHVQKYDGPVEKDIIKKGEKKPHERGEQNSVDVLTR